jgi:hypothetical protein
MRSRGFGSADEPAMQESEEPMDPGTLVQEVNEMRGQDAAPADEEDDNEGEKQPEDDEKEPSKG